MEPLIKVGEFAPGLQEWIDQEFVCHTPDIGRPLAHAIGRYCCASIRFRF